MPNGREVSNSDYNRNNLDQNSNQNSHLNNSVYNKILPEIKHITCLFVYVLFYLIIRKFRLNIIQNSDIKSITQKSKTLLYVLDFGPINILMLLYPLMFYLCHKELRTYWKNQFTCLRRNQD